MFLRISSLALAALLVSGCANNSPVLGNKNISYGDTSCRVARWFRSMT
jgi:hypothetical protein